jgi:glycine/D-amino acid oxidase-like deaminating enzyme
LANRTLVVGAGIVGINCALALQARGADVEMVDIDSPGSRTSFGNAGCFAVSEILPVSLPGLIWSVPSMLTDPLGPLTIRWRHLPQLAPWLWRFWRAGSIKRVHEIVRALSSLLRRTWQDYDAVLSDAGVTPLVEGRGALALFRSDRVFRDHKWQWRVRRQQGIRAEILDRRAIHELEPALAPIYRHGYFLPDWGHTVDPHRLTTDLAAHFSSRGGAIRRGQVVGFEMSDNAPALAFLEGGNTIAFDNVVICAGAWSKVLCAELGYHVPLDTERCYNTTLPKAGVRLMRPVSDVERNYVMPPMREGLRVGGAVELAGSCDEWTSHCGSGV